MGAPYTLYKISEWLSRNIPLSFAYFLGRVISMLVFYTSPKERRAVKRNVCRFNQIPYNHPDTRRKAGEIYKNFSRYYVDLLYESRKGTKILDNIDIEGIEVIDDALDRGKGAIILSAHIGNWELGAMAIAAKQYPLSAIAHKHRDPRINRFFVERRMSFGIKVVPAKNAVRQALNALHRNELVAVNGDRRYSSDSGANVTFFGQNAVIPKGPAYLSLRSGACIIGARCIPRGSNRKFCMTFSQPIYPENRTMTELSQGIAELMEPMIADQSSHWFAFEDIWGSIKKDPEMAVCH